MLHWRGEMPEARLVPFRAAGTRAGDSSLRQLLGSIGSRARFGSNAQIFGESSRGDYLYEVVSGAVRVCKFSDGRRQILAFYLPGDVFGLERDEVRNCAAEAIGESIIVAAKRTAFLLEATRRCAVLAQLWAQTVSQLHRLSADREHVKRKNAPERLAGFLLNMADRLSEIGTSELLLPHQDIADYLEISAEAISQSAPQLERDGRIAITASRRVMGGSCHPAMDVTDESLAA